MEKTNAMRYLDTLGIHYDVHTYETKDGKIDGVSVAKKVGINPQYVYKTLVLEGDEPFVAIVPVEHEIHLKKLARAINEKKITMLHQKDLRPLTGYVHGGCSPFAMKKELPKYVQEDIAQIDEIYVSGGKVGVQISMKVEDFLRASHAVIVDMIER